MTSKIKQKDAELLIDFNFQRWIQTWIHDVIDQNHFAFSIKLVNVSIKWFWNDQTLCNRVSSTPRKSQTKLNQIKIMERPTQENIKQK